MMMKTKSKWLSALTIAMLLCATGYVSAVGGRLLADYLQFTEQAAPALSAAGQAVIHADSTSHRLQASINGGASNTILDSGTTVTAAQGGTGVSNAGTITNATNSTITGGGTLALGGFTLTAPATGTAALLGTANTFTLQNIFEVGAAGAAPLIARQTGGVAGTDEVQLFHDGGDGYVWSKSGVFYFGSGAVFCAFNTTGDFYGVSGNKNLGADGVPWERLYLAKTVTAGGTTGNQTINKSCGTVNIAAAGTTVTVTNDRVATTSIILCTIGTNDATAEIKNAVAGAGSFVITLTAAATAEVRINWLVIN
jgi:hypothetical protein